MVTEDRRANEENGSENCRLSFST